MKFVLRPLVPETSDMKTAFCRCFAFANVPAGFPVTYGQAASVTIPVQRDRTAIDIQSFPPWS